MRKNTQNQVWTFESHVCMARDDDIMTESLYLVHINTAHREQSPGKVFCSHRSNNFQFKEYLVLDRKIKNCGLFGA